MRAPWKNYYPILTIAEQKEHKIGKYGLLHRDYIKQHKDLTHRDKAASADLSHIELPQSGNIYIR